MDAPSIEQRLAAMQDQIDLLTAQLNRHLGVAPGKNTVTKPHPQLILRTEAHQAGRYM